jgi:LysM domain
MNAVQAVALPPNRSQNRGSRHPGSPRPSLYLVPSTVTDHPVADGPVATLPAMARPRAARPEARGPAATGPAARGLPASSLRLTRRGRVVVAAAAALLVAALSMIAATQAQATSQSAPAQHLVQMVVRPGQSLWAVAESADPGADTRLVIQRIIDLNGLTGDTVQPGQRLWVPRS